MATRPNAQPPNPVDVEPVPPPAGPPGQSAVAARLARLAPAIAGLLLLVSMALPYWSLTLHAPQYPDGLTTTIFTDRMTGDVEEIDELNHYIGMMKLGDAARFERRIAPYSLVALATLGIVAAAVPYTWGAAVAFPIVVFPIAFVVDLFYWLNRAGHDLDPHAPLSSSVRPFTPHLLGFGTVGQFATTAQFEAGYYLAALAAILTLAAMIVRLRNRSRGDAA